MTLTQSSQSQAPDVDPQLAQDAVELAAKLLQKAETLQTSAEKQQGAKLARMMDDPRRKNADHAAI